ncbi:MAG TPA: DUF488 family protein [Acidimicrobiales bacterium]|jgi:uncharacterized protein YeaO (DUF488 family)|nr:DUF488 family protein [Acidimicrobiales bacterium]
MGFAVVRIYEDTADAGYRVLVDRLWPRGVRKDDAHLDEWNTDVAPSAALRKWYGHDVARFDEFARRYRAELARPPGADAVDALRRRGRRQRVVLLTATKDVEHSGAQVLVDVLRRNDPFGTETR